jgi:hypothetical protein
MTEGKDQLTLKQKKRVNLKLHPNWTSFFHPLFAKNSLSHIQRPSDHIRILCSKFLVLFLGLNAI